MRAELFYVHDPMCSWCWGFARVAKQLFNALPDNVSVHRLLGGLAKDNDQPMPLAQQKSIQGNWVRIEDTISGVKFNFDFWAVCQPRRSTYPACRAVIAARMQGDEYDEAMTFRIQQAYYEEARNPSDNGTLIELAVELGLDEQQFSRDLLAESCQQVLLNEVSLSRKLGADSFPSLILKSGDSVRPVTIDYLEASPMLVLIEMFLEMEE